MCISTCHVTGKPGILKDTNESTTTDAEPNNIYCCIFVFKVRFTPTNKNNALHPELGGKKNIHTHIDMNRSYVEYNCSSS